MSSLFAVLGFVCLVVVLFTLTVLPPDHDDWKIVKPVSFFITVVVMVSFGAEIATPTPSFKKEEVYQKVFSEKTDTNEFIVVGKNHEGKIVAGISKLDPPTMFRTIKEGELVEAFKK